MVDASGGTTDLATLKDEIKSAVESTVGYSAERGDVISVSYVPFAPLSTATDLVASSGVDLEAYIKYTMMLLVILVTILWGDSSNHDYLYNHNFDTR